jgi:AcrR family transcriptional regulator
MSSVSKPTSRLAGNSRKQEIVRAILDLTKSHGTEAVSAQLVADAIGVTQPAIFRHFPTKEAMWLAVMDWLEECLVSIYSTAGEDRSRPALVVLSRMFLDHVRLISRHPALAKLVLSDHLRLQYPSLQTRFGKIHKAYTARICAVLDVAKSEGSVPRQLKPESAAAAFLAIIQGLGFQFTIARLPIRLPSEAERSLIMLLQAITASTESSERAHAIIEASKKKVDRKSAD